MHSPCWHSLSDNAVGFLNIIDVSSGDDLTGGKCLAARSHILENTTLNVIVFV